VRVHDPLLPALTDDAGVSWASEPHTPELLAWSDVTVILADHRQIAWAEVFRRSRHVVDTRNAGRLISPA
jgi:UDP-N-acetyl-D-mannosaminuronate dehydrogenase